MFEHNKKITYQLGSKNVFYSIVDRVNNYINKQFSTNVWDQTEEDALSIILSFYLDLPIYTYDYSQDYEYILRSGIGDEMAYDYYTIELCEDEWCCIINPKNEIIYARFINYKNYQTFREKMCKLITDYFKSEGFNITKIKSDVECVQ